MLIKQKSTPPRAPGAKEIGRVLFWGSFFLVFWSELWVDILLFFLIFFLSNFLYLFIFIVYMSLFFFFHVFFNFFKSEKSSNFILCLSRNSKSISCHYSFLPGGRLSFSFGHLCCRVCIPAKSCPIFAPDKGSWGGNKDCPRAFSFEHFRFPVLVTRAPQEIKLSFTVCCLAEEKGKKKNELFLVPWRAKKAKLFSETRR